MIYYSGHSEVLFSNASEYDRFSYSFIENFSSLFALCFSQVVNNIRKGILIKCLLNRSYSEVLFGK